MSQKETIEIPKEEYAKLLLDKVEKLEQELFKKEKRIAELEKIINE